MNWLFLIFIALLFFVLTPGILLSLPPNGNKYTVAAVHAIVFSLVYHFTHKMVKNFLRMLV
jgi:hypothetical protein